MAQAKAKKEEKKPEPEPKSEFKFFRNKVASGLRIVVNMNPNARRIEFERFTAVREKYQGDDVKVGYLATKTPKVIGICEADGNCIEIEKKEFVEAVGKSKAKALMEG